MKYRIKKIKTENVFALIEKSTGYTITRGEKTKIHRLKKHMENGGAFDGQTPYFIAQG